MTKESWRALWDSWRAFFITFFHPWVLLLLVSTVALGILITRQENVTYIAILTVLMSIFSGILGGIIAKRWDDLNEEKKVVTKGKSAIRNLQHLFWAVILIERESFSIYDVTPIGNI